MNINKERDTCELKSHDNLEIFGTWKVTLADKQENEKHKWINFVFISK